MNSNSRSRLWRGLYANYNITQQLSEKKESKNKILLKNEIFKWHHCLETEFANKHFDGKGLIPICRVYYTKKISYVFMVPSTNQPGFFFFFNSIVFKIKLSTQKNYGEKMK